MPAVEPDLDAVGIGNALVDVLVEADPAAVADSGVIKGTMALMSLEEAERIHARIGPGIERSGGSAANAMVGLVSLGARVGFIGRTARDRLGRVFADDLGEVGIVSGLAEVPEGASGRCLILITPDADRTMCTALGVAADLSPGDIDHELVTRASILYLEGYLFDPPAAKVAFRDAASTARSAGRRVALSLSDPFCVERHRDDFAALVADQVDIVFGNEEEVCVLTGATDVQEACARLRRGGLVLSVTLGARGALALSGDGPIVHVPAAPVSNVVDTTGAGDLYAAGFLRGLTLDYDLERCARLGALAAAEIISHVGARPEADLGALAASLLGSGTVAGP